MELTHVPQGGKTARERFRLKEFSVWPRGLAEAAVAHDKLVSQEFQKTLGRRGSTVATAVIKVGELVKVVGFDASPAALEDHKHYEAWATSGILEGAVSGELR